MAIDFSGGLDEAREYFVTDRPVEATVRESASLWVSDKDGVINFPRIGIEKPATQWDTPDLQVNIAFPDGRAVVVRDRAGGSTPIDDDGIVRRLRAGGLEFRCVEPFAKWAVTYEGSAYDTTAKQLAEGGLRDAPMVDLAVQVEATMAAPPWVPGTLVEEAGTMMSDAIEGVFISDRYEQLVRTAATVRIGSDETSFTGTGLRIRRFGARDTGAFWGHCWQSALFPSGRGFGFLTFPPRPDGEPSYNEGYVFDGERLVPATVVDAPWLRRLAANGEDWTVVLRTPDGDFPIRGELLFSTFLAPGSNVDFALALHQSGCRYAWDGEQTHGMMERSSPVDKLVNGSN